MPLLNLLGCRLEGSDFRSHPIAFGLQPVGELLAGEQAGRQGDRPHVAANLNQVGLVQLGVRAAGGKVPKGRIPVLLRAVAGYDVGYVDLRRGRGGEEEGEEEE